MLWLLLNQDRRQWTPNVPDLRWTFRHLIVVPVRGIGPRFPEWPSSLCWRTVFWAGNYLIMGKIRIPCGSGTKDVPLPQKGKHSGHRWETKWKHQVLEVLDSRITETFYGRGCLLIWKQVSWRSRAKNQSPWSSDGIIAARATILNHWTFTNLLNDLRSRMGLQPLFFFGTRKYLK